MHEFNSNLVFGFHGCEAAVRDELLLHPERIKISEKPFDWLGHGLYFWEGSVEKAWQWAKEKKARGEIQEPAVIGALLQLGNCCDLLDSLYIDMLSNYHQLMVDDYRSSSHPMPENKDAKWDLNKDKLLRYLDCAVIEYMHLKLNETSIIQPALRSFDSIRGAFFEGGPVFEGSGIYAKSHIQLCIRNPRCIKVLFRPLGNFENWKLASHSH